MANRWFEQFAYSLVKGKVFLYGKVTIGAAGAPTLVSANSKGISSIVRNSAGKYTITLQDKYNRLLHIKPVIVLGAGTPAAPFNFVVSESVASAKTIVIQFLAVDGTTATDPASGEEVRFEIQLKNSSV
jgi:hypothetical protein